MTLWRSYSGTEKQDFMLIPNFLGSPVLLHLITSTHLYWHGLPFKEKREKPIKDGLSAKIVADLNVSKEF